MGGKKRGEKEENPFQEGCLPAREKKISRALSLNNINAQEPAALYNLAESPPLFVQLMFALLSRLSFIYAERRDYPAEFRSELRIERTIEDRNTG